MKALTIGLPRILIRATVAAVFAVSFNPAIATTATTSHSATNAPGPVGISTASAIALTRKLLGDNVASHMVHRVLATQSVPNLYFTTNETDHWNLWSGYVSDMKTTSHRVSSVQGYFQYRPTCGGCVPTLATWVGIGGLNVPTLIQTGIDQSNGKAFYELLPKAAVEFSLGSVANDPMVGVVSRDYDTGYWYLDIQDFATNQYYANEFNYATDQTTAEWVVENTNYSQGTPSFTAVTWSHSYWTATDSIGTVRAINNSYVNIVHRAYVRSPRDGSCLSTSVLASGAQGFTSSRTASCP